MTRVVAKLREPKSTKVSDVATKNPICVPPETPVADAVVPDDRKGLSSTLPVVGRAASCWAFSSVRDALPRRNWQCAVDCGVQRGLNDVSL